jgi:ribosomal-protein-alanine N-acetyltransferase
MNKAIQLFSDRLVLKPITVDHASEDYVSWMNDKDVNKYLDGSGNYSLEKLQSYLNDIVKKDLYFWAIHIKDSGKHIGNIKIDSISDRNGIGIYGILMGDRLEWGRGYAKEASQMVIDFCFKTLGLRKISLGVIEDNVVAVELYYKLGFVKEGLLLKHGLYNGKYCNSVLMSVFNPEIEY